MKKSVGVLFLATFLVLSMGLASAGWFSDAWNTITGNAVSDLDDGLVLHYEFETDVKDSSGNGYDGSNSGVNFISGKIGNAGSFNEDYVRAPQIQTLNNGPEELTLAGWVNIKEFNLGYANERGMIITKGSMLGWDPQFSLDYFKANNEKQGRFEFSIEGGDYKANRVIGTTNANFNEWYHAVAVYDGQTMKIYVNGVLENEKDYAGGIPSNNYNAQIGAGSLRSNGYGSDFSVIGDIDDVRIYDRALSSDEVKELYEHGGDVECTTEIETNNWCSDYNLWESYSSYQLLDGECRLIFSEGNIVEENSIECGYVEKPGCPAVYDPVCDAISFRICV